MISVKRKGFTLLESLLAGVVLSAAVLAIASVSVRAMNETRVNRCYERAMSIADRQLRLIDYTGVAEFIESGRTEGEIDWLEPGYSWKVEAESVGIEDLYEVAVTVSWIERNRQHSVSLQTRLNGVISETVMEGELIE